jgi:hypothetical protein
MVQGDWESCEDGFEVGKFFWCKKTSQTIDLDVCPARQKREMQECTNCRQKNEILEIRKFMGHKPGFLEKKKIIKKSHEETEEEIKTLQKKAIIKKEVIITTEQKPKLILHKRIKEEEKPIKKTLIKKGGGS